MTTIAISPDSLRKLNHICIVHYNHDVISSRKKLTFKMPSQSPYLVKWASFLKQATTCKAF